MARNFLQLGNGKAKCQLCGDKIKTGIPQISHRAYQSSASFHANAKDCFPRSKAHIKKNGCPHCGVVDIDGFRKRHIYEGFECTHCYQPVSADRYKNAEEYNVEFNEWADQEMNSHGKNISFKDWSKDEGLKHGNSEITEWAQHEDESHDARYGAESFSEKHSWIEMPKPDGVLRVNSAWRTGKHWKCEYCHEIKHTSKAKPNKKGCALGMDDDSWEWQAEGKKRSGILSEPFEEASLDSGGTKKVLLGIGLGIIGYFGYNKWK